MPFQVTEKTLFSRREIGVFHESGALRSAGGKISTQGEGKNVRMMPHLKSHLFVFKAPVVLKMLALAFI